MLWYKAFHIIFIVTWFSGLFYLPRLFMYHTEVSDAAGNARFKVMEKKLYYAITTPSAVLATVFGLLLLSEHFNTYLKEGWMHGKLLCVVLLWIYHLYCGRLVHVFQKDANTHSSTFYRWFNEIPSVLLIATVILVVVKL